MAIIINHWKLVFEKSCEDYHSHLKPGAIWGKLVTFQSYCHLWRLMPSAWLLNQRTPSEMWIPLMFWTKDLDQTLRSASVFTKQWLLALRVENHCLFLTRCVCLGKEECSCLFLWRLFSLCFFSLYTINMFVAQPPKWLFVYSSFVDWAQPPPRVTLAPC